MAPINDDEIYRSAVEHSHQLSTLRFAILTVFMTATGALLSTYFLVGPTIVVSSFSPHAIAIAGIWLAVVFFGCEIALSFTMATQNEVATEISGKRPRHRHPFALWAVRLLISSVYVGAAGYWIHLLYTPYP